MATRAKNRKAILNFQIQDPLVQIENKFLQMLPKSSLSKLHKGLHSAEQNNCQS